MEPAYNFRKRNPDESREGASSIMFRLGVHLRRDLRSVRTESESSAENGEAPGETSVWDRKGDRL